MGFKEWIIPQEKHFFDLLSRQSDVVLKSARLMSELVRDVSDLDAMSMTIEEVEDEGDELVHDIVGLLNRTFVTPIDHDDISKLTSRMDDVIDHIDSSATRLRLYGIRQIPVPMIELVDTLHAQTKELNEAVHGLCSMRKPNRLMERCVEVNRLENVADDILHSAVAGLFKLDDVKMIIKLKEIYEYLEDATDRCEDVADVVKDVLIKNA